MNHTINTTSPVQTDVIGVDIDRFSIDASLTASDTDIDVTYSAGTDKWWLGVQVVGVRSVGPSSIPAISEWGMNIFFIFLVGSALWVIRRRTGQQSA
jgi:hypothetical protein